MSELTIAMPLSAEEIGEAILERYRSKFNHDCHLNPALAYPSFKYQAHDVLTLYDNGREIEIEIDFVLEQQPPNVVRQSSGQPIPTLVEDAGGRKEIRNVKYKMSAQSGPGGTQQDPSKPGQQQEQNPHRPGTPEHEKHEKERKEREEKEKKEKGNR